MQYYRKNRIIRSVYAIDLICVNKCEGAVLKLITGWKEEKD